MHRALLIAIAVCATSWAAAARAACVGDCSGDGTVTIDELVIGVSVALNDRDLAACPSFDANGDGSVTIDELLQAVHAALTGCPTPTLRPTPRRTHLPTVTATASGTANATPTRTPTPTEVIPTSTPSASATPSGTLTLTPTATVTVTSTSAQPTDTPTPLLTATPTATATPTCAAQRPVVNPLTSPTDKLTQAVTGAVVVLRSGTVLSVSTETDFFAAANPSQPFALVVPLAPNQTQVVQACLRDPSCPLPVCTDVDRNGAPLEVIQLLPTPRSVTPTPTETAPSGTPTGTPEPIDCGAVAPLVDVVGSSTTELSATITGTDLVLGPFTIIRICSEAGCATTGLSPNHPSPHPFALNIDLLPDTIHHLEVCAINNICHDEACTQQAANGDRLDIVQTTPN